MRFEARQLSNSVNITYTIANINKYKFAYNLHNINYILNDSHGSANIKKKSKISNILLTLQYLKINGIKIFTDYSVCIFCIYMLYFRYYYIAISQF